MLCRERAPLRAGYMGHLTEIANSLQAVAARRPAVARTLCSNAAWTDFAFGPLAERNQVSIQVSEHIKGANSQSGLTGGFAWEELGMHHQQHAQST